MNFAWIKYLNSSYSKREGCTHVSNIYMKEKVGKAVNLKKFEPKHDKDFSCSTCYFTKNESGCALKDITNTTKYSRINILFLARSEKELCEKRETERVKYVSSKIIQEESSFEEDKEIPDEKLLKKHKATAASERGNTVLQKLKKIVEVKEFVDTTETQSQTNNTKENAAVVCDKYKIMQASVVLPRVQLDSDILTSSQTSTVTIHPLSQHNRSAKVISQSPRRSPSTASGILQSKSEKRSRRRSLTRSRSISLRRSRSRSHRRSRSRSHISDTSSSGPHLRIAEKYQSRAGKRSSRKSSSMSHFKVQERSRSRSQTRSIGESLPRSPVTVQQKSQSKSQRGLIGRSPSMSPLNTPRKSRSRSQTSLIRRSLSRSVDKAREKSRSRLQSVSIGGSPSMSPLQTEEELHRRSRERSLSRPQSRPQSRSRQESRNKSQGRSLSRSRSRSRHESRNRSQKKSQGPSLSRSRSRSRHESRKRSQKKSQGRSLSRSRSRSRHESRNRSQRKSQGQSSCRPQSRVRHESRNQSQRKSQEWSLSRSRSRSRHESRNRSQRKSRGRSSSRPRSRSRQESQIRSQRRSRGRSLSRRPSGAHHESRSRSQRRSQERSRVGLPSGSQTRSPQVNKGRRKVYKMTEFVYNCINYYKKDSGDGAAEYPRRYDIQGEMVYLGEEIHASRFKWDVIQIYKPTLFLNELALILWDARDLCNRALDVNKTKNNIPGRSPIKLIEKYRLRLLISLYSDFLLRQSFSDAERVEYLLNATHILRMKIRNLRAEELAKHKRGNPSTNPRRKLRYDWIA